MPEQFIKVKHNDGHTANVIYTESIKKQESTKFGSSSNISNSNGDICRICHCEADVGNQLLSPCYCSGSLKYVHQSCLQQWLAASNTRSCELCKFIFILHTKIKPISEWRRLEMSSVERRRLLCAILFHFVAAVCVVWSLFVLIDRAAEEVQKGLIAWPFWTKLVVVAVGFTGGAVFMYIQCRQYLHLFSRWKAHNRIIIVQNAPEKAAMIPPSPNFTVNLHSSVGRDDLASQVLANVECNLPPSANNMTTRYVDNTTSNTESKCLFENENHLKDYFCLQSDVSTSSTLHTSDPHDLSQYHTNITINKANSTENPSDDTLELNIQEILALDVEYNTFKNRRTSCLGHSSKTDEKVLNKNVFKSLPNLSASNENLLV